jgi:hypothetical protein
MDLLYYLDTNAVQSLGLKLRNIPANKGVYTSVLTIMELLKRIEDEDSYKKKVGPIVQLLNCQVFIDPLQAPFVIRDAFGIDYEIPVEFDAIERIITIACKSQNYKLFYESIQNEGLTELFNGLKTLFKIGNDRFKESLAQYNEKGNLAANRIVFKERWEGDINRQNRLNEVINYYAKKQASRYDRSVLDLLSSYDHSIDLFMLINYYYDEKKNYCRELAADNDGFDIQHLLYLRKGCKLVTDDRGFQKYVNEVFEDLAIGTKQFMEEIE